MKKGFTLIELLIVISIIGTLTGLIINNLSDSRLRARDSTKKTELRELKTALRLYYNDHQAYPANSDEIGLPGNSFNSNDGNTIYMKRLPAEFDYTATDNQQSFILKVALENPSDPDIAASQKACPGNNYDANDYVVCDD